jgi:hypothetical protein
MERKAMAQGRRLGQDMGLAEQTEDWGDSKLSRWRETILEVSGAYLFETPQSGVRNILRFLDATDSINDDDCDDDVRYDSGGHNTDDTHYKPKNNDGIRYKPNTSQRR